MFDLTGKKAVITGASGGIGAAIAKALHAQGAEVVLSGTRIEALQSLAEILKDRVHTITCNLGDLENVDTLIDKAEEAMGGMDILVNNAGLTRDGLAMRMKDEDWQQVLDINLTAPFRLMRRAIKGMMKNRYGRIINISSIVGVGGNPGQANYVASKAGIIGASKVFALETATRGITVNCVAPGFIETAMTDKLTEAQSEKILNNIPMGRQGSPEDIANAVLFLASQEASYITGQTIHVNGGMLMV